MAHYTITKRLETLCEDPVRVCVCDLAFMMVVNVSLSGATRHSRPLLLPEPSTDFGTIKQNETTELVG